MRTEKRPGGIRPHGRMKDNITLAVMKFHIHSRYIPEVELHFFDKWYPVKNCRIEMRTTSRPVVALYLALLKRNSASAVMWSQP